MNIRDVVQIFGWGNFHLTTKIKVRLPNGTKVPVTQIVEEDGEAVIEVVNEIG